MEGTADLLHTEVRCPNCMEWTFPCLPKAGLPDSSQAVRPPTAGGGAVRPPTAGAQRPPAAGPADVEPELMGKERLDELVGANETSSARHSRRRRRKRPIKDLWYVLTDSGPKGPYAKEQIVEFARQGKINQANELRNATTGVDCPAGDVPDLFPAPDKPAQPEPTPHSDPEWYVQTAKSVAGPFTNAQVITFAKDGKITAKTMLRKGHAGDFTAAENVRGLLPDTQ